MSDAVLAVHGGAGGLSPARLPADREAALRAGLAAALIRGQQVLAGGGSALDAVVEAVVELEDAEVYNAGRGAVLRADGTTVLDAAVMQGADQGAGAVAGVRTLRNPIRAARAVLEHTAHVLLTGDAAEAQLARLGLDRVAPDHFVTPERTAQLAKARAAARTQLDHDGETVGAVARDAAGHVAAATSTGGMTNALPGRIGDSPLIGSGTWADARTCAVSGTGHGELFIRAAFAHEIDALMRIGGHALDRACELALLRVAELGGSGGCVAVDATGEPTLCFNTTAMPRGIAGANGPPRVAIFQGEPLRKPV